MNSYFKVCFLETPPKIRAISHCIRREKVVNFLGKKAFEWLRVPHALVFGNFQFDLNTENLAL